MADFNRTVSLNPSDFKSDDTVVLDIVDLIEHEEPDKIDSQQAHYLDTHFVIGIGSVKEALDTWSVEHDIGYRELSRYACLVAANRMYNCAEYNDLSREYIEFISLLKDLPQNRRVSIKKAVDSVIKGYSPVVVQSYHVWCWGDKNKKNISGMLKKVDAKLAMLGIFLADAISDLPDLSEIKNDLIAEKELGIAYINYAAGFVRLSKAYINDSKSTFIIT